MDIGAWLDSLGLGDFAETFRANRIRPEVLPSLTNEDLKELGVTALGDRKLLLASIAEMQTLPPERTTTASEGERRQVTVLFADIADFTGISERLGAEVSHEILNRYFEAADRIVVELGGSIDKHIGDNVMAVFGAPVAHENDPERAVRAALAIHEAANAIALPDGLPLRLHLGIASGQVVASGTGSDSHREYTVTGESVNLAARLQDLAGPGETLISENVHRQTLGLFATTSLGVQRLKGIARGVQVWRVDATAEMAKPGTPFVGRRSELGQIRAILSETASTGHGLSIMMRGAAGIGKTRLAHEVLAEAVRLGFATHRGLVLDFGSSAEQAALPALVRSLLSELSSGVREGAEGIDEDGPAALDEADRAAANDLLGLGQPLALKRVYDAADATARRERRRALLGCLAICASRNRPQLILVEDLHWADGETLDALARLMEVARDHPIALLATTRPEEDPLSDPWRTLTFKHPVSIINLAPLRQAEAEQMALAFVGSRQEQLAECLERAGGNPLFLEQLLQNVAESASGLVPASIQSLVHARMDRLAPTDKRAVQAASVFGQRFSLSALRALLDDPSYQPVRLLECDLVRPEGDDFLFAHALIRDGVYDSILTPARRSLHLRASECFAGGDLALWAEHLKLAGDGQASRAYLDAARAEATQYRFDGALALLSEGRVLAESEADTVEIWLAIGEVQHDAGALDAAEEAFAEAQAVATDDAVRCRALLGLASVKRITGHEDQALSHLEDAEAIARRAGLVEERARVHCIRGNVLFPSGDAEGCVREHGEALALARRAGLPELEAQALSGLGDAEYIRGRYRTALSRFSECIETSRKHGFGRIEVANLPMLSFVAYWCGDANFALETAREAVETAKRVGHGRAEIVAHCALSQYYRSLQEHERERSHAEISTVLSRKLGARHFVAECQSNLALAEYALGNREAAHDLIVEALAIARHAGVGFVGAALLGILAYVTDDAEERRAAIAEGEALLAANSISHNHIHFRIWAFEALLRVGAFDEAERHADRLAAFCPDEQISLVEFHADRGRALAKAGRGDISDSLRAEFDRLIAAGEAMGERMATERLRLFRAGLATV